MRARTKPCRASFSSSFLYSPLRPRTMGARIITRSCGPQRQHLLQDLFGGLARDFVSAVGAMRHADGRVQHAQIIVNFGDGADGRARAAVGGLLLDRNRRAQAVDRIDLGPLHLIQKLARVGRKRFDVAALALGVDRVEGERRLARSAQPRDHGEGIARNLDVDVLQVVLPCPVHGDAVEQDLYFPTFTQIRPTGFALESCTWKFGRIRRWRAPVCQARP